MKLLDDYSVPFDPQFTLASLSRDALARLGREYLMAGHIHDRALMPMIGSRFGPEAMTDVAIDEWMGSSPIYNARNRANLRIEGDGISSIFKGFQFDVGAPHQYMDFHYEVKDESLGYFWLDFCGAYHDVSRMAGGKTEPIIQMCVHMEDPTFDATVMAVNPHARCRPIHRPPLAGNHTGPVCRWEVSISGEAGIVEDREITKIMRRTRAATFEFDMAGLDAREGGGMDDYAGPFRPDFVLEDLSHRALVRQCKEFAIDLHLLVRASHLSVLERWGSRVLDEVARDHWAAAAPVYVERIRSALGMRGDDIGEILKMLQVDPAFPHDYVDFGCRQLDDRRGQFWISSCEALRDGSTRGWLSVLDSAGAPGFDAAVAAVNPQALVRRIDPSAVVEEGHLDREAGNPAPELAWEVVVDESAPVREESNWARATRVSSVAGFRLRSGRGIPGE
jgi:hypothetical protein